VAHRLLTLTALLSLLACQAPAPTPARPPVPFVPKVALRPLGISLARGASQDFHVDLNLPEGAPLPTQAVTWSVLEAGGGSVTPGGRYPAPQAPGIYHVQVQRLDFPQVTATAAVLVK
jgi:hypothetical protein